MQKTILLLGTQIAVGGAQRVLLTQAEWFHKKGYHVIAAFLYDKEGLHQQWSSEHPFEILNFDIWRKEGNIFLKAIRFLFGLPRIFRYLKSNQVDIIETFTADTNLIGIPLAYLAGIPKRLPTTHGFIRNRPPILGRIHGKLINSKLVDCLIVVSNKLKQGIIDIEKVKPEKIKVILNGINIEHKEINRLEARRSLNWSEDAIVLLNVGRLDIEKGQKFLIEALPAILEKFPQAHLYVAGEGNLREALQQQIESKHLQDNIELLGVRSEIYEMLRAADIFVLPSLWEGLSIALLEAMAAECPVLVSDVEGIDDLVTHGVNGYVIPVGDVEAVSSALLELISNPDLCKRLGKAAREHVAANFSVDAMCLQYEKLFM